MLSTEDLHANDPTPMVAHEYDINYADDTHSLSESILEQVYEHGRMYHVKSQGKYPLPSDEMELDRLDLLHHMYLELLSGRVCLAPVEDHTVGFVLDCGTGTGIWALDFGDVYPSAEVTGIDLAPTQPELTYPNVRFEVDDLEKDWTFPENHFGFIHSRDLGTALKDWPKYVSQMYTHTAPGGYVEISEHDLKRFYCDDGTMPADSALHTWSRFLVSALAKGGIDATKSLDDYRRLVEQAGFVDVVTYEYKIPVGAWPRNRKARRLGAVMEEIMSTGLESYSKALLVDVERFSESDAISIIQNSVETMRSNREHFYYLNWILVGRKPRVG